jgi:hypothetical protein
MSISIDMKELSTSISKLNALLEFNILGCLNLLELPTSIGQLNALQNLHLNDYLSLQKLFSSIGRLTTLTRITYIYWRIECIPKP